LLSRSTKHNKVLHFPDSYITHEVIRYIQVYKTYRMLCISNKLVTPFKILQTSAFLTKIHSCV